jgi:hypothetical protein
MNKLFISVTINLTQKAKIIPETKSSYRNKNTQKQKSNKIIPKNKNQIKLYSEIKINDTQKQNSKNIIPINKFIP